MLKLQARKLDNLHASPVQNGKKRLVRALRVTFAQVYYCVRPFDYITNRTRD